MDCLRVRAMCAGLPALPLPHSGGSFNGSGKRLDPSGVGGVYGLLFVGPTDGRSEFPLHGKLTRRAGKRLTVVPKRLVPVVTAAGYARRGTPPSAAALACRRNSAYVHPRDRDGWPGISDKSTLDVAFFFLPTAEFLTKVDPLDYYYKKQFFS
jgi:hypothetical protein